MNPSSKPNSPINSYLPTWIHQLSVQVSTSKWFRRLILATITLAGAQVGIETYTEDDSAYQFLFALINGFVLVVFLLEAVVKILAEGDKPLNYFKDGWNRFDFFILLVCLLPFETSFVAVVRMARLLRVLKFISALPQLRLLTSALLKSVPSIGNVVILLVLHFYIFGTMATILFSQNDPVHFGTLHISILSLFRTATLEDWTDLMYINIYGCDQYGYDSPRMAALCTAPEAMPLVSAMFFSVFVLTGSMIILNLFIGVIMTGMEESRTEIMMNELSEKKKLQGKLSIHEEIVMVEGELQALSSQMQTLNSKLFHLLSAVKDHNTAHNK